MTPAERFPLGHQITLEELDRDPYPTYARLRSREPVTWCRATGMYLVTRLVDVRELLRDTEGFVAGTEHSLILDTFGEHMLTTEGVQHDLYKKPLLPLFRPLAVKKQLENAIKDHVKTLIDGFRAQGKGELRAEFASRLPVLGVLSLFGLPGTDEPRLRAWYDSFERALANFTWDEGIRAEAHRHVGEFHDYLQKHIDSKRTAPDDSLLSRMISARQPRALDDDEIRRNASIIFFGGISTVEALILNSLYVLTEQPALADRLGSNPAEVTDFLDEVVRWAGPVQSATRHVTRTTVLHGVEFAPGDTVNCMLAAANHDPEVFPDPDRFDMDRPNLRSHIGFAVGSHHCLGSHLAKLEAGIALQGLLTLLPGLRRADGFEPSITGYEFRQPKVMHLQW